MKKILFILLLPIIFSCGEETQTVAYKPAFDVKGDLYQIGNPTDEETYVLELINRARANPEKEGIFLTNTGVANVEQAISYFKVNKEIVKSDFKTYTKTFPLAFNKYLNAAAKLTSEMQRDNDVQAHEINGIDPGDRMTQSGYKWRGYGENIYAYSEDALYSHAGFNIDWGNGPNGVQNPPGHRNNIMGIGGSGSLREAGICVLNDIPAEKTVGPKIVSHDFGIAGDNSYFFITGVIYNDLNNNNFYDMGEGVSGVTISADNGKFYAVSTASGAYTIPFSATDGITKIQAFSDNFATQVANVTLESKNYKLDFNVQNTGANGDASVGFKTVNLFKTNNLNIENNKIHYSPANYK